jgi:hypothetical protein
VAYPDVNQVLDSVRTALHQPGVADLLEDPWWQSACQKGLEQAVADFEGILGARGFDSAQQQAWGQAFALIRTHATYWSLVYGGPLEAFDDKFVNKFDQRPFLQTARVTGGDGRAVAPSGLVGHGRMIGRDEVFRERDGTWKKW